MKAQVPPTRLLERIDEILAALVARREAAIVEFREALNVGPEAMPRHDPFVLTALIDRKLDERLVVMRYLAALAE